MKRFLLILLTLMLCFAGVEASAEGFNLVIDSKTANSGETIEINATFENNPGLIGAVFSLEYDKTRLELTNATDGGILEGGTFSKTFDTYPYKMVWNSASHEDFTDNGTVVTFTFKVLETAQSGDAFINISYDEDDVFNVDMDNVALNIQQGKITVTGDSEVTGNEVIDNTEEKPKSVSHSSGGGKITKQEMPQIIDKAVEETEKNTISFTDVIKTDWYYSYVTEAYEKGYMTGVSETEFAPSNNLTRAMFVTVLYRIEGEPAFMNDLIFDDVEKNSYYEKAVAWANGKGIVSGMSETKFAPNDNITREQIATILYRYARYKEIDTESITADTNTLSYNDIFDVSDWASSGMHFCVAAGIINGDDSGNVKPKNYATRAEMATMISRFTKII